LRASSNGQAFDCSASKRSSAGSTVVTSDIVLVAAAGAEATDMPGGIVQ
jgi:hypothetical protein